MQNQIYYHAKKINKTYLSLIDSIKNDYYVDNIEELYDQIARWPKTHTFCFKYDKENNKLLCTWSKVYDGNKNIYLNDLKNIINTYNFDTNTYYQVVTILDKLTNKGDVFCKKEGKRIAKEKMDLFISNPPRTLVEFRKFIIEHDSYRTDYIVNKFLFTYFPAAIANTLPWYCSRAIRYFKIENNININIESKNNINSTNIKRINVQISKNNILKVL